MTVALPNAAELQVARAQLYAFTERLTLENLVADYRRGRDPSDNLNRLLKLQATKRRLGLPRSSD